MGTVLKLHLVFPMLPPAPDAIGDHTALLAQALAPHADVAVLTTVPTWDPLPGVAVHQAFSIAERQGVQALLQALETDVPDWLVLQYNPFSYGTWGLNPYLPETLQRLKQRHPRLRVAMLVHETAPPLFVTWQLTVMNLWQRWHLRQLGRLADRVFFTIEPWVQQFGPWFPQTPAHTLPIGSNIPCVPTDRATVRTSLGFTDETFVLGIFGTAHHSRLLHMIRRAAEVLRQEAPDLRVLYVGPHGPSVQAGLPGIPVHDAGRLPGEDVSRHFAAMDLYCAPFRKGLSTRRGSFMTALQHGIPTVSNRGVHTGRMLREADGTAFLLSDEEDGEQYARLALTLFQDAALRQRIGAAGQALYQTHFDWPVVAQSLVDRLQVEKGQPAVGAHVPA
jgi:glycosyltransferase involved in cell wall biosynthesis